ncbi:transposase [Candidatus Saccharibacteria bacterium]|nr:transposase [Candidatus Saccharibacteria bacterium]
MPSKNAVKEFDADAMYHVYNRGNNKRIIFFDERDYAVFLSFLKYALLSGDESSAKDEVDTSLLSENKRFELRRLGLAGKVDLVSYCLMPNHFHLQLYQYESDAITKLMRSIATGYVMYFNKRYETNGSLFQGVYKASRIKDEGYFQHISRYIHLNPLDISQQPDGYDYSSYKYYIGLAKARWVKPQLGLAGMGDVEYARFVKEWILDRKKSKTKYLAAE